MRKFLIPAVCLALCLAWGCASKQPASGGKGSAKPYTVRGKTYYPLKSSAGFVEEGLASWYGPGFHGKTTASGEKYNQYAMTAAHKILPLGTKVRVTRLDTGRSVLARVNDRGPFSGDRVIDLSKAAASRLDMLGSGTARVRVQTLGDMPEAGANGDIKGSYYIQLGAFGQRENAKRLVDALVAEKRRGRLKQGANKKWIVQLGPWPDSLAAENYLAGLKKDYPAAFVVGDGKS